MNTKRLQLTTLSLALFAMLPSAHADEAAMMARIEKLAAELQTVKAELAQLKQQSKAVTPSPANRPAPLLVNTPTANPTASQDNSLINGGDAVNTPSAVVAASNRATNNGGAAVGSPEAGNTFFGYGEINYNRPRKSEDAQADVRRIVFGAQHRFDAKTKFVGEVEVEHAVASSGDKGEVAIEQAYIEHQVTDKVAVQAGLFLMPMGILNENHEPNAYYGVERNFVETAIIPSTWREGGFKVVGTLGQGVTLQGGISTSFDLNKWDATSTEGQESPLGSIHQEMSQAKAKNAGAFLAADWRGVPGLRLGASAFVGNVGHGAAGLPNSRLTLWDVHGRWQVGNLDLSALYARGTFSNTAAWNTPLVGNTTLIPSLFDGGYVQAAYKVWQNPDYSLTPFARAEWFNTGRKYEDLGAGLTPDARPTERVLTVGANFGVGKNVVLKTDYQWFKTNKDLNRFNVGLGWAF